MSLTFMGLSFRQSQKVVVSRNKKDKHEYTSSLEDITQSGFHITYPLHNQVSMSLKRGDTVYVKIPAESFSMEFNTHVKGFRRDNVPIIVLEIPEEYTRVQRRSAVRLEVLLDISIAPIPKDKKAEIEFVKATALDISAGGMEILSNKQYEKGSQLFVAFDLRLDKRNIQSFCIKSVIRRSMPMKTRKFKLGVQFEDISRSDTDKIVQYIFKKSAELR